MIYYPTRDDCPSKKTLAKLDIEQAAIWVAKALSHSSEVNRLAQFQTWWSLSNREAAERHRLAVETIIEETLRSNTDGLTD